MKKILLALFVATQLAGCVTPAKNPTEPKTAVKFDPPMHCTEQRECEIMWSDAQRAVDEISDMRIRLLTDTRIETYAPVTFGRVGAIVTKVPSSDSGYDIKIQVLCYAIDCDELKASVTRLFNTKLEFNQKMNAVKAQPANTPAK